MVNDTSEGRRGAVIYGPVEQLRSPTVLALGACWRSKQRGRPMPALEFTGLHLDEIDWGIANAFVRLVHDTLQRTAAPVLGHYQWGVRESVLGFAEFGAFPLSDDGATVSRCVGIDDFTPFETQLGKRR